MCLSTAACSREESLCHPASAASKQHHAVPNTMLDRLETNALRIFVQHDSACEAVIYHC